MSANAGQIDYIIDMDTRPFLQQTRRVQSENTRLGRSFNGLDDTVGRLSGSFGMAAGGMSRLSVGISQAIGPIGIATTAITATTGALLAFTASTTHAIKEIEILAHRANTNTSNFQAWAHATSTVNIQMDELSGIFQDVNDRMGEFTGEGSGELEHAFEKFLKPAGLTVETLREMAGQDALQAIVKGMQDGGASANEMTAVLEMVASNASHLLPLLLDNGKAAKELFKEAETGGLIISNEQIQQAKEFDRQWKLIGGQVTNFKNLVAIGLTPAMGELVSITRSAVTWLDNLFNISDAAKAKDLMEEIGDLQAAIAEKTMEGSKKYGGMGILDALNPFATKGDAKQLQKILDQRVAEYEAITARMNRVSEEIKNPTLNSGGGESSTFKPFTLPENMLEKIKKDGQQAGKSFMLGFGAALDKDEGDDIFNSILDNDGGLIQKLTNERERILEFQELGFGDAKTHAERLLELDRQIESERSLMLEERFRNESEVNAAMLDGLDALGGTAANVFSGLLTGSMSASDAMRAFANTVLNEAIGSLTEMGVQYLKNQLIEKGASAASVATAAATGSAISAAYAPAAAAASLATMGANSGPAMAGITSTYALSQGLAFGGGRENGGGVSSSSYYQMGEGNKPEVLQTGSGMFVVPGDNGRVFNQGQLEQINGGSGGSIINLNVYTSGGGDQVSMQQDGNNVNLVIGELVNQMDNKTGPFNAGLKRNFLIKENLS